MHPIAEQARAVLEEMRNRRGGGSVARFDGSCVRNLRKEFQMTQEEFADRFGFSLSSVRNWETGHRAPEASSQILLGLVAQFPNQIQSFLEEISLSQAKEAGDDSYVKHRANIMEPTI